MGWIWYVIFRPSQSADWIRILSVRAADKLRKMWLSKSTSSNKTLYDRKLRFLPSFCLPLVGFHWELGRMWRGLMSRASRSQLTSYAFTHTVPARRENSKSRPTRTHLTSIHTPTTATSFILRKKLRKNRLPWMINQAVSPKFVSRSSQYEQQDHFLLPHVPSRPLPADG